jgi:hypothetical protein
MFTSNDWLFPFSSIPSYCDTSKIKEFSFTDATNSTWNQNDLIGYTIMANAVDKATGQHTLAAMTREECANAVFDDGGQYWLYGQRKQGTQKLCEHFYFPDGISDVGLNQACSGDWEAGSRNYWQFGKVTCDAGNSGGEEEQSVVQSETQSETHGEEDINSGAEEKPQSEMQKSRAEDGDKNKGKDKRAGNGCDGEIEETSEMLYWKINNRIIQGESNDSVKLLWFDFAINLIFSTLPNPAVDYVTHRQNRSCLKGGSGIPECSAEKTTHCYRNLGDDKYTEGECARAVYAGGGKH